MRRRRYQKGSLKKRCGKWIGQWREEGVRRNQVLGSVSLMTKSQARAELDKLLASVNAQYGQTPALITFGQFVKELYYPLLKRKWKRSTATNKCQPNRHASRRGVRRTTYCRAEAGRASGPLGSEGRRWTLVQHG